MFDVGPYYITALVNLLGPLERVTAAPHRAAVCRASDHEQAGFNGHAHPCRDAEAHLTGTLDFVSGATATVVMSFDTWSYPLPCLLLYAARNACHLGSARPEQFQRTRPPAQQGPGKAYDEFRRRTDCPERSRRGAGVADMAYSILRPRNARTAQAANSPSTL